MLKDYNAGNQRVNFQPDGYRPCAVSTVVTSFIYYGAYITKIYE